MKQIVYRVVGNQPDGTLASLVVGGKAEKTYKPEVTHKAPKWLADKGYHITAFRTRKAAQFFVEHVLLLRQMTPQIWKAEATGVIPRRKLPPICWLRLLSLGELDPASTRWLKWPAGTVMCKTIKLLEKVEE